MTIVEREHLKKYRIGNFSRAITASYLKKIFVCWRSVRSRLLIKEDSGRLLE